ncbi:MAG: hypothetical protein ACRC8Q_13255 [Aeromonas sp.]
MHRYHLHPQAVNTERLATMAGRKKFWSEHEDTLLIRLANQIWQPKMPKTALYDLLQSAHPQRTAEALKRRLRTLGWQPEATAHGPTDAIPQPLHHVDNPRPPHHNPRGSRQEMDRIRRGPAPYQCELDMEGRHDEERAGDTDRLTYDTPICGCYSEEASGGEVDCFNEGFNSQDSINWTFDWHTGSGKNNLSSHVHLGTFHPNLQPTTDSYTCHCDDT